MVDFACLWPEQCPKGEFCVGRVRGRTGLTFLQMPRDSRCRWWDSDYRRGASLTRHRDMMALAQIQREIHESFARPFVTAPLLEVIAAKTCVPSDMLRPGYRIEVQLQDDLTNIDRVRW